MRCKNKSITKHFLFIFLVFFFFSQLNSFGQYPSDEINLSDKPVYYSLSKALRNASEVYKLNLSNKDLKEFPEDIFKLKELRYLILDSNKISSIPPQIAELHKLKCLSFSTNNIKELPSEIGSLSELRYFYVDHNQLSVLPPEFYKLAKLEEVFINSNQLTVIAPEIKVLKELRRLVAANNKFESIPDEIGYLYNLKKLSISNNLIKELPEHFYELTNLINLYFSENQLIEIDAKINKLNKLEVLALDKNKIKSLPPETGELIELTSLYIEENLLDSVPKEIGDLFKLKELFMGNNPMKVIPTRFNHLSNLKYLNIKDLVLQPFPQVLYDLQNNGTKIVGLTTNELYQAKIILSQARNKKLTENYPQAILKYEQLIKLDTNNVMVMSELASAYLLNSEYDKSAVLCRRALTKNASQKTLEEVRTTLSNSLNKTNKFDLVVNEYLAKIKSDSTNPNVYFDLGKFYFDQQKFEEAQKVFFKAVKIDPNHAESHFYLAILFLQADKDDLFVLSALRLFELEPNSTKTKTTFPFILTRMKMKSGVEKRGSTSYFDSYIIRNENNEIVYKSESPQADLLTAMLSDLIKNDVYTNDKDSSDTDSIAIKVMEAVLYTNKSNTEIFQLELTNKTKKTDQKEEDKVFWNYYLPYYSEIIENGYLETYSNIINSIRGNDPKNAKWLKANIDKVDKYVAWNKKFKWLKY